MANKMAVATLEDGTDLVLRLRELRGDRSYADLSRCTGIRADELSKIENGKTSAIAWSTLARLLHALNVGPEDLLEVREPIAADPVTTGMLAALANGTVSAAVTDVWVRGEGRVHEANAEAWAGTEPDAGVELTHRRETAGT
jgi:DNA-binding Xre family transcriptional regulator